MVRAHPDVRFGSSGIRGATQDTITPELALAIGRACGVLADRIILGRDARTTSPQLERALAAGAQDAGVTVTRAGLQPTPTIAYGARDHDLGVVVTASHNPAPDNGFKLFTPRGASIGSEDRERLLDALENPPPRARWDAVGDAREDPDAAERHIDAILSGRGPFTRTPRVVVDPGNGAASHITPRLLRRAGASVMTLNAYPDGTFPARQSEPTPEALEPLSRIVAATDAVCGLAHDGDGDRIAAVDEDGRVIPGDALIVLAARALDAERIVVPVDTSRVVWDALPGADIQTSMVGDAHVSERLARIDGDLGGEPSGSIIAPELSLCPDGPHAALMLAGLADQHGGLATIVDELPTYETRRRSLECAEPAKEPVMQRVHEELATLGETTSLDGVRVDTDEGWVLVRPSGTEPKLRITAEANAAAQADQLLNLALGIVDRAVEEVGVPA